MVEAEVKSISGAVLLEGEDEDRPLTWEGSVNYTFAPCQLRASSRLQRR